MVAEVLGFDTPGFVAEDAEDAEENSNKKQKHCRLAIDDFGKYSVAQSAIDNPKSHFLKSLLLRVLCVRCVNSRVG